MTICVGRRDPFQSATHLLQKFLPVMVTEREGPPVAVLLGESAVSTGVRARELVVEDKVDCATTGCDALHKNQQEKEYEVLLHGGIS